MAERAPHSSGAGRLLAALMVLAGLSLFFRPAPAPLPPSGVLLHDQGQVDLNRASLAELEALPGVGPRLAQELVAE